MSVLWDAASKQYRRVSDPVVSVQVLGPNAKLAPNLSERVIHLKVKAASGRMSKVELTFYNEDGALSDSAALAKGTQLRVQWGYCDWLSKPRIFRIKKVKGTKARVRNIGRLTIEAYSSASALHGTKRAKKWQGLTYNQIAASIARSYGLQIFLGPDDGVRRTLLQSNQTDAQFMAEMAQKSGLIFAVENDTLMFARAEDFETHAPVAAYTYYVEGEGSGWVMRFEPESDVLAIPGAVRVVSRDPKTRRQVEYTANINARRDRVLGRYSELVGDDIGASPLGYRYLSALQSEVTPNTQTVTLPNLTAGQCKAEAEKRLRTAQARSIKARTVMIGNPDTWDRQMILLYGVGTQISGLWRVVDVEHEVGSRGYTMLLHVRRDGISTKPRGLDASRVQKAKTPEVAKNLIASNRKQPLNVSAQSGVAERNRFVRR